MLVVVPSESLHIFGFSPLYWEVMLTAVLEVIQIVEWLSELLKTTRYSA